MSTAKEINAQRKAHFLHLAQGVGLLRSNDGDTYLYENGAPRLFKGLNPESAMQRCDEFPSFVDGCLWCIENTCNSRSELDIYASLEKLFRDIT